MGAQSVLVFSKECVWRCKAGGGQGAGFPAGLFSCGEHRNTFVAGPLHNFKASAGRLRMKTGWKAEERIPIPKRAARPLRDAGAERFSQAGSGSGGAQGRKSARAIPDENPPRQDIRTQSRAAGPHGPVPLLIILGKACRSRFIK